MSTSSPLAVLSSGLPLEPLLAACRGLGCHHLSLLGSALRQPLAEVGDVDLHLVMPRVDRSAFGALAAAAGAAAEALAAQAGRPCRLELRHGPFKPAPRAGRQLQLHLLVDDDLSLTRSPCALLARRAATGRLLAGERRLAGRSDCEIPETWLREARTEMIRWHGALAAREIPFRSWVFDPAPRLAEGRKAARTAWDLRCLLRGAAAAADLHFGAVLQITARKPAGAEDLARPLLSQIGEPPWQSLARSWDPLRDQALAVLERRLAVLRRK